MIPFTRFQSSPFFSPQHLCWWVSLTPWRKRFVVIAGFPLSGPPRGNAKLLSSLDPSPSCKQIARLVNKLIEIHALTPQRYTTIWYILPIRTNTNKKTMQKCIPKKQYMTLGSQFFFSFDKSLLDAEHVSEKSGHGFRKLSTRSLILQYQNKV